MSKKKLVRTQIKPVESSVRIKAIEKARELLEFAHCSVVDQTHDPAMQAQDIDLTVILPERGTLTQEIHHVHVIPNLKNQYIPVYEKDVFTKQNTNTFMVGVEMFVYFEALHMRNYYEKNNQRARKDLNGNLYIPFTINEIRHFSTVRPYPKALVKK